MARTSKKRDMVKETGQIIEKQEVIWNAGIYARLSVDKNDQKNVSIDIQMMIAKEYISKSDNIQLIGCYTDLGRSGTNFEREGFEQMMADVRQHKINCIIVKDFSRFGRNYIEAGNYIEKIFPFFNVRFIAVSDGFDSHRSQGTNDLFAFHLKNIVNELYARDCAEKVRAIKKSKLEQGCYVGGIPSYGYYARWIDGKKILFPEEGTSDVVRKIYELYDNGGRIRDIVSYLHEQRIHRPKEYQATGHVRCEEGEILKQWSDTTIKTILTNYVYIGTLIQNRVDGKVYHSRGKRNIEPDEVIMIEHTHEAIIEEDMFFRISSRIEEKRSIELQRKKLPKDNLAEDIYKDLIYCGECGHKLKRICTSNSKSHCVTVRTYFYGCPKSGRIDEMKCDSHFVTLNMVNQVVLEILRKEFDLSGISVKTIVDYNCKLAEQGKNNVRKLEKDIQARLLELNAEMSQFYIQYKENKIDKKVFLGLKEDRDIIKNDLEKELLKYQEHESRIEKEVGEINHFIRCLEKCRNADLLDGEVIHCLIKKIIIYKDKRMEIIFNFNKEQFERYKESVADEA